VTQDSKGKSEQAQGLIDRIETEANAEIAEILARAAKAADEQTAAAHKAARTKVRAVVEELRRSEDQQMARANAALQTQGRQQAQIRDTEAVATGLTRIDGTLVAMWADPDLRDQWCDAAIAIVCDHIPCTDLKIDLPQEGYAATSERIAAAITRQCCAAPEMRMDPDMQAGLRFTADATSLDASAEALSSDEGHISAMLLSELKSLESEGDT
jgi:hypothetical protein